MKADEIKLRSVYAGGKNGDRRYVIQYGRDESMLIWGHPRNRLVHGGYAGPTFCTSRAAFAKWATNEVTD